MILRRNVEFRVDSPGSGTNYAIGALTIEPPAWMANALCAQTDPEAFFPEKGGSTREAKRICERCPVAAECIDYALLNQERFGIWGGLSERDRRRIHKRQQQESA